MKRMETTEKVVGDNTFYIRPFSAFTAANISGELSATIAPIVGALAPLLSGDGEVRLDEIDVETVLPTVSEALGNVSGDKLEHLMRRLLVDYKNVSVEGDVTDGSAKTLTADLADEIFCGELQDMLMLCIEVLKVNFGGFFRKLGVQFGNAHIHSQTETPITLSMASLT